MLELRNVFLERIHIEVLVEHTVVPTVQGNAVVDGTPKRPTRTEKSSVRSSAYVDIASDIYLLMQFFVSPCPVQLEPVCSHVDIRTSLDICNIFTILLYQNWRHKSI